MVSERAESERERERERGKKEEGHIVVIEMIRKSSSKSCERYKDKDTGSERARE